MLTPRGWCHTADRSFDHLVGAGSRIGGTLRPSAFAVLRLTDGNIFVGNSIGKSMRPSKRFRRKESGHEKVCSMPWKAGVRCPASVIYGTAVGGFVFDFVRFVAKSFMRLSETTPPNIAGTPSLLARNFCSAN